MKIHAIWNGTLAAMVCAVVAGQLSIDTAQAQVLAIGPDGVLGYVTTRQPTSPNCIAPQVWTLSNGHYMCANPPPPPAPPAPPAPPPPVPPTIAQEGQACLSAWNAWTFQQTGQANWFSRVFLNNPGNLGGPLTGPFSGNGLDQYNAQVQAYFGANGNIYEGLVMLSGSQPTSQNDMFEVGDYFCWVQPQTVNVIGLGQGSYCSPNGGSANCGGGGYGN